MFVNVFYLLTLILLFIPSIINNKRLLLSHSTIKLVSSLTSIQTLRNSPSKGNTNFVWLV